MFLINFGARAEEGEASRLKTANDFIRGPEVGKAQKWGLNDERKDTVHWCHSCGGLSEQGGWIPGDTEKRFMQVFPVCSLSGARKLDTTATLQWKSNTTSEEKNPGKIPFLSSSHRSELLDLPYNN